MRRMLVGLLMIVSGVTLEAATPDHTRFVPRDREAMDALYSVMSTMSMIDRRIIFHGLSADSKAALWTIHLEKFAAGHQLTPDQNALIVEAKALFSPALYSLDPTSPDWENHVRSPLRSFDQKAIALFPRDLAIEAFARLGPDDVTGVIVAANPGAALVTQSQGLKPGLKPVPLMPSDCSCSTESDWCWAFSTCGIGGVTCYRTDGGCGTGWAYDCNSKCSYGR